MSEVTPAPHSSLDGHIPQLRFSGFSCDWSGNRLGNISDVSKLAGYEYTKYIKYKDTGYIIALRGLNIKKNKLDLSEVKYIDNSDFSKLNRSKLFIDDLMFTYIGTIGEVALIDEDDKYFLAPNVSRIRFNKEICLPRFAIQYFNRGVFKRGEIKKYISSSSQPALTMGNIRLFILSLPSLSEQQKIATFLTVVDNKIEQLTKKQELLGKYKKGLMQQIFSQTIRFKADDGSDFPDWEERKLGDCGKIKKGKQLNKDYLTEMGNYPAINGGINPSGYTDDWNTKENTITISEGGNSCGYVNLITTKFWSGGHCYSIEELEDDVLNIYLFQYLKFNESFVMRLRVGSGLPNIQKGSINNFNVNLPSNVEQANIANFLSSIDHKIEQVVKQLDESKQFKKALLQQMFV